MDEARLVAVFRALERLGVRYVVFGAMALNLHGLVRATEDLDIFLAADGPNIDALKRALRSVRLKDKADAEALRRRFGTEVD